MSEFGPVAIDLLTQSLRFSGFSSDADPSKRLSDLLNGTEPELTLRNVTIRNLHGINLESCELAVIQKRDLLMAIPRETTEQMAARRSRRIGVAPPQQTPLPVVLAVTPYLARGIINYRGARDFYRGTAYLSPFFPLLDANLRLDGQLVEQSPVVLVNRELVVAVGVLQEGLLRPGRGAPLDVFGKLA